LKNEAFVSSAFLITSSTINSFSRLSISFSDTISSTNYESSVGFSSELDKL